MSLCNSTGRGHLEAYTSFFLDLIYVPFHFAGLDLYPFTVISCNCDYNTISESYKSFKWIREPEDGLGDSDTEPAIYKKVIKGFGFWK